MEADLSPPERGRWLLDDAWNPVLVKDVRQALRGRLFTYGFITSLTLACVVTLFWSVARSDPDGRRLYVLLLACLSVFDLFFIPLATFRSLASEAEEGRLDHLSITRMSALRIVLGKLGAAMVQVALCILAFAPFLLMCGLARGIDTISILHGLLQHCSAALFLASTALAAALMARGSYARLGWQVALIALCAWSGSRWLFLFRSPVFVVPPQSLQATVSGLAYTLGLVVFFITVAAVRVQSDAENRSSTLRIGTSIAMGVEAVGLLLVDGGSSFIFLRVFQGLASMLLLALPALVLVTESPQLSSGERHWIRRHPRVPAMYAPGRDTAVLFLWVHLLLILGAALVVPFIEGTIPRDEGLGALLALPVFICVYWILPSSLLGRMSRTRRGRFMLRVILASIVPAVIYLPPLFQFLLGGHPDGIGHPLNPFYALTTVFWKGRGGAPAEALFVMAMPMWGLLLWRSSKGVRQVRALRRS